MGRFTSISSVVAARPITTSSMKALPMVRSASSLSPRPRAMAHSGEPPVPHRLASPMMTDTMGMVTPMPVSARWLLPGRWPR